VCPRCGTILLPDEAICERCGKILTRPVAACDACGRAVGQPPDRDRAAAVRSLRLVPGIDVAAAKRLYAKGYTDFSQILRDALPEEAARRGLHRTIARRLILAGMKGREDESRTACPACGGPLGGEEMACPACDFPLREDVSPEPPDVPEELADLASDPDFLAMPEAVRAEILSVFEGFDPEDAEREEYRAQIEAWRGKGFDVRPLERLLKEDVAAFRSRSVRIIRAQLRKNVVEGAYVCPICEVRLAPEDVECENCGAKFA
jgi:hypothetical protein